MALGIGFGADRIGAAALRFPRVAAVCLIVLMGLIAASVPQLRFDDDINRAFLTDSPLSQAQRALDASQDPPLSTVIIHVSAPAPFSAEQLGALRNLTLDFEFLDGVVGVASPFALRWPPDGETPNGRPVFGPDITSDYATDLADFRALGTGLPTLIAKDRTALVLALSVDLSAGDLGLVLDAMRAEIDRALPEGLSAGITGEKAVNVEVAAALSDELLAMNLIGILLVAAAAFLLLRDVRMALLAVVPAICGAAGVVALAVWLGFPLTVLSNVIPTLLLVIGVADGVHLAGHLKETRSARAAVRDVGPACALTALTTAVAFGSITLTGNSQLFEFGLLGALGTLFSFGIVIVTFALLALVVPVSDRPVPTGSGLFAARIVDLGHKRPRLTVAACLFALGASALGYMMTTPWFPVHLNLPGSSPIREVNDALAKDFGGAFQTIVETDGDWATVTAVTEAMEARSSPGTVLSELTFARWLGTPEVRPTAAQLEGLPNGLISRFRMDGGGSRIFVAVPEPMRTEATLADARALQAAALSAGATRIIGLPAIMQVEAVGLVNQLSIALVAAALGATLLVAFAFRTARLIPVLIIPNILPMMVAGATLHLWGQGLLTPAATLALTIAFGIAIDDTVHYLSRFAAARAAGETAAQAVVSAARSAGQVIVLSTLLLTAGLAVTLGSDFYPVRLFGGMMILTLWVALLVDLLLLPALLTWKGTSDEPG